MRRPHLDGVHLFIPSSFSSAQQTVLVQQHRIDTRSFHRIERPDVFSRLRIPHQHPPIVAPTVQPAAHPLLAPDIARQMPG
eukprot:2089572-Rhodomonas_salina.5